MKTIIRHLIVATAFMLTTVTAIAQPSVKGRVTDADGQPLEGVAVLVQGTANGTLTDGNGSYVISVKKGDVILFSSLGLGDQTFVADGTLKTLNVVMKEDASFIEETVVVGYGTQKKSSMTAAVSSIKGDELLKALPQTCHSSLPESSRAFRPYRSPESRDLTRLRSASAAPSTESHTLWTDSR